MYKFTILAIFLVTASAVSAELDKFLGEWTPVAMYPKFRDESNECATATLTALNDKCTCADGKVMEVLGVTPEKKLRKEDENLPLPVIVIEDVNDVSSSMNVTCKCEDEDYPRRVLVKSVSDDYFLMYFQPITSINFEREISIAMLLVARNISSQAKLLEDIQNIEELRNRSDGHVFCTSDVKAEEVLRKPSNFFFP